MFGTTQRRSATTNGALQIASSHSACFVTMPIVLGPATEQVVRVLYAVGVRGRSALSAVSATVGSIKCDVLIQYSTSFSPFSAIIL